jgi:hypothetical protein
LIPYAEKLVSDHLRSYPGVEDLEARVRGTTPDTLDEPWVRVTMLDASQTDVPDHLVGFYFQFDCYAGKEGGQPEASLLARTVREALTNLEGTFTDGTVSGVRINGQARIPDPDADEPARERVILTATVYAHS